jgi:lysophospholipase L1-like esterase
MKLPGALGCGICAALIAAAAVAIPTVTGAAASGAACVAPAELVRLDHPLSRTGRQLAAGLPLTIVTIGSSSTAGAGASSPAMSYPSRLEVELKTLLPRANVKVVNRGVGGETVKEMLARFDNQVIAEKPDVVVWQVGSNSVLRDQPLAPAGALIRDGLRRLKAAGPDVILMNPQYAPKVIAKHDAELMVDLISLAAKDSNVDLFQRFAVMRHWRLTENIPFETFVSPDELHMNDWSYACIAKLLAGAIAEAATRPTQTAGTAAR